MNVPLVIGIVIAIVILIVIVIAVVVVVTSIILWHMGILGGGHDPLIRKGIINFCVIISCKNYYLRGVI